MMYKWRQSDFIFSLSVWIFLLSNIIFSSCVPPINGYEISTNRICRKPKQFRGISISICRSEPELIAHINLGLRIAVRECKNQFKNRKWDCMTRHRTYNKILKSATREAAYLNAIISSAILHSITVACSSGSLWQCHCNNRRHDSQADATSWEWGGCSDDVEFSYNKSRSFTDIQDEGMDLKNMLITHNMEAGRMAVKNNMRKLCKCHGLSGSCALKTCWMKVPYFNTVGRHLLDKYDGAPLVTTSNDGYYLIPEQSSVKPPTVYDLVYTEKSPDFCNPNTRYGSNGTIGRVCRKKSLSEDGCGIMCCDRGYHEQTYRVREKCRCKFVWCCKVECEVCESMRKAYVCN